MEVNSTTHCWSILDSATSKQCHILLYILCIGMNRIVSCWLSLPYHVETKAWFEVEVLAAELVNTMVAFSSTVYVRYSPLCLPKYSVLPTVPDAALSHLTLSYYIMRCIASTSVNGSRLTHCRSILDSVTSKPYHILPYIGIGRVISWLPSLPHHVETEVWFDGEGKAVKEIEVEPKYSVPTIVADVGLLHSTPSY